LKRRSLFPALVAAFFFLVVLNLLIGAWSRRLPYRIKLNEIRSAQAPNLLFVGNSLLAQRVDEGALVQGFGDTRLRPLNAALGASGPPEHELLFNYAVRTHPEIRTLVIGFFDQQLTADTKDHAIDLTGNRLVGFDHRFSSTEVSAVYGFGSLDRMELVILRRLPIAANRQSVWKYVELLRRRMGGMGMPQVAANSMGNVSDFAALEASSPAAFDQALRNYLDHPGHFSPPYEAIIRHAEAANIKVILVSMPMSPSHWSSFYSRPSWNAYLSALHSLAGDRKLRLIDASGWMTSEDDFVDHLHMSKDAAHRFSMRLGQELAGTL
jgi:hypothetical protein